MRRRIGLFILAPVAGLTALAAAAAAASDALLINESPSLPEGLYRRSNLALPQRGDVVAVDPPAQARAYLTGLGMPASVRLLKRVAATPGERACAEGDRVRVGARELLIRRRDRRGMALPIWSECRALAPDEIFVVGDSADSFDSRYFGPVRARAVAGIYREVLTW